MQKWACSALMFNTESVLLVFAEGGAMQVSQPDQVELLAFSYAPIEEALEAAEHALELREAIGHGPV